MFVTNLPIPRPKSSAWNRGRIVGQKRPLLPKHVDGRLSGMRRTGVQPDEKRGIARRQIDGCQEGRCVLSDGKNDLGIAQGQPRQQVHAEVASRDLFDRIGHLIGQGAEFLVPPCVRLENEQDIRLAPPDDLQKVIGVTVAQLHVGDQDREGRALRTGYAGSVL